MIFLSKYWQHFTKSWTIFWFQNVPTRTLSLLRIFIGIILFMKATGIRFLFERFPHYPPLQWPEHQFSGPDAYRLDGFYLPVPGFKWLPTLSFDQYELLEFWTLILTIIFLVGFLTKYSGPLLALCMAYPIAIDQFGYHHNEYLLLLVVCILAFTHCSDYYSLDSLLHAKRQPKERMVAPIRMIQILVTLVYTFSAITKINMGWLTGGMIQFMGLQTMLLPLMQRIPVPTIAGPLCVIVEGTIPILLWHRRSRFFGIFIGITLHYLIDVSMHVGTFSYLMIFLYIAFLEPVSTKNIFEYSATSVLSRYIVRIARLLNWFQRVEFRQSEVVQFTDRAGNVYVQRDAWLQLCLRLPLTFYVGFILDAILWACSRFSNLVRAKASSFKL